MNEQIKPELIERMVALVRDLYAEHLRHDLHDREQDFCKRTAAIVAELPAPVDPDWAEAGRICVEFGFGEKPWGLRATDQHPGRRSSQDVVLAAIKRGRELERGL